MRFLDLPLVLVQDIIAQAAAAGSYADVLRLRLVNRLFDHEVMKYFAFKQLRELQLRHCTPGSHQLFQLRLLRVHAESEYCGKNEFKVSIQAVADDLSMRLAQLGTPVDRRKVLQSVCKVALDFLGMKIAYEYLIDDSGFSAEYPIGYINRDVPSCTFAVAVAASYTNVVEEMLESGLNPDFETSFYGNPLLMACELGYCKTARLLLDYGADLHRMATRAAPGKQTALQIAARNGHMEIVDLLLELQYGMDTTNVNYGRAILEAIDCRHFDTASMMIEQALRMPMSLRQRICYKAAEQGYDSLVIQMLDAGVNMNAPLVQGNTALYVAASRGHCSTTRLLLKRGSSPVQQRRDAFLNAAKLGRMEILELMLQNGVDLKENSRGFQAFVTAAGEGNRRLARFLLRHGLDLHPTEAKRYRSTALTRAIEGGHYKTVRWLVADLGFSPNGENENNDGSAPMITALEAGRPDIVKLLFELGAAPIDLKNTDIPSLSDEDFVTPEIQRALEVHNALASTRLRR